MIMKFSAATITLLALSTFSEETAAFAPYSHLGRFQHRQRTRPTGQLFMAAGDVPPPSDIPVLNRNARGGPTNIRYSDFLRLVDGDQVEKVTFR